MSDKEIQMRSEIINVLIKNAIAIEEDDSFRYYFGLAKLYVKEDLVDDFEEYITSNYGFNNFDTIIRLTAIISHEINTGDDISIYQKLNEIINLNTNELYSSSEIIRKYIKNGNKIDKYLFKNTTRDFVQKQKIKLNDLYKNKD